MENEEEKGNVLTITFWFVIIVVVNVLIFGSTWRRRWSCLEEETLKSFHWNVKWAPVIEYFYFGWSVSYENSMKNHRELASEERPVNHQVDHLPHNSLQWKYYHSISAHIRVWLLLWKKKCPFRALFMENYHFEKKSCEWYQWNWAFSYDYKIGTYDKKSDFGDGRGNF